jgi:long-chain acyl-CoA synthetase
MSADCSGFLHRFLDIAERHPDALAIHSLDDGQRLTYRELRQKAEQVNGALEALGVEAGQRVMLLVPNGVVLVSAYLATIGRGAVPVLANPKLTGQELRTIVTDAQPAVVLTAAKLATKHAEIWPSVKGLTALLSEDAAPELPAGPARVASLGAATAPRPLQAPEGDPIATIQYTYKGLGYPLPVAHRYSALGKDADALQDIIHPQGVGSTFLVALPLYSIFGLASLMVLPLTRGATMLITNALVRHDFADLMAKHQITLACLVPDLLRWFIAQLKERSTPLPQFHPHFMPYSGGSHLSFDVAKELGDLLGRPPILQGYGLTESFPVIAQSTVGATADGAIGRPLRDVEVRVVDDAGVDVAQGQVGELHVRGPMVTREYLGKPEATALFFRDGWLHTGDLVKRDAEGNIFFVGRRLRITKITAQMVDLAEIEAAIAAHPGVERVRARVVRDAEGRNSLRMTVAGTGLKASDLNARLRATLSSFKVPRSLEVVDAGRSRS